MFARIRAINARFWVKAAIVVAAIFAAPGQILQPMIHPASQPGFFGRTRSALAQTGAITTQNVVTLVIVGLLVAILMPFVFTQLGSADQSGWTALTVTIWDFLPAIIGIALLLGLVGFFAYSRRGR